MEISNTQIFKYKKDKVINKLKNNQNFDEKKVQKFYQDNLKELLDLTFIKSEFSLQGGRVDTFGIDNDNNPVIIEYKRDTSNSVLLQALSYKKYLSQHWEKAHYIVAKKLGEETANKINWKNIRIVIIAQEFDKWTIDSISSHKNVQLCKFAFFEDNLLQIFVNAPKKKTIIKSFENNLPNINDADFSKDEWVFSSSGKKRKTNLYRKNNSDKNIQEIWGLIVKYIENTYPNHEITFNIEYWVYKAPKKFMEIIFKKFCIDIRLSLKKDEIQKSDLEINKKEGGIHGTLRCSIKISKKEQLSELYQLINISYENIDHL